MSQPKVQVATAAGVTRLTLNRPDVGNAVDLETAQALLSAAIACDADEAVRCVVLTGAGRFFCVGGDVALFRSAGDQRPAAISELAGTLHMAESKLARMNKPLLVLVNGPAAGAGFGLALLGDVVLASSASSFTPAYGALGLSPDGGLSWLLPRLVGLRRAQEIILTGRKIDAAEGEASGMITRVIPADDLETAGREMSERLASGPTRALGAGRNLLLHSLSASLETHMENEARAIAALSASLDAEEGLAAFTDKRPARFEGR